MWKWGRVSECTKNKQLITNKMGRAKGSSALLRERERERRGSSE